MFYGKVPLSCTFVLNLLQEQVLKVWHSLGLVVREQMGRKKGVRLDKFGSFGFDIVGEPCFNISSEFSRSYRVRQTPIPTHDNAPISKINFTQLSKVSGLDRVLVEKIYSKYISCFGSGVRTGQNALLTIHRVAEIFVSNDSVKCAFMPEFIDAVMDQRAVGRRQPGMRPSSAPRVARSDETRPATAGASRSAAVPARSRGNKKNVPRRGKKQLDVGQSYRNPITGDGDDSSQVLAPSRRPGRGVANRGRNPILDGDDYSEYSEEAPRSRERNSSLANRPQIYDRRPQSAGPRVSRNPSGGREILKVGPPSVVDRRAARDDFAPSPARSKTTQPVDARAMAARALGSGDVVGQLKERIIARGGCNGIKSLGRLLRIMDNNGDKRLSREELTYGLRDYGISMTKTEIEQLFLYFDRDHNGFIDIDEFLIGIRGELNDRRKKLIRMAFDILDTDGSGLVTIDELSAVYDVSWNPAVRAGKLTERDAMKEFMAQWDRLDGDGMVSIEEFEDYYKGVSSSIDGDDYFELMIRNAWRIPGGVGMAANTANKRVLVTNRDGSQNVVTVENELGMKPGDKNAVRARLAQQGIDPTDVELHGGMDTTERASKVSDMLICRFSVVIYLCFVSCRVAGELLGLLDSRLRRYGKDLNQADIRGPRDVLGKHGQVT